MPHYTRKPTPQPHHMAILDMVLAENGVFTAAHIERIQPIDADLSDDKIRRALYWFESKGVVERRATLSSYGKPVYAFCVVSRATALAFKSELAELIEQAESKKPKEVAESMGKRAPVSLRDFGMFNLIMRPGITLDAFAKTVAAAQDRALVA